jgi:hypothetical protein
LDGWDYARARAGAWKRTVVLNRAVVTGQALAEMRLAGCHQECELMALSTFRLNLGDARRHWAPWRGTSLADIPKWRLNARLKSGRCR